MTKLVLVGVAGIVAGAVLCFFTAPYVVEAVDKMRERQS